MKQPIFTGTIPFGYSEVANPDISDHILKDDLDFFRSRDALVLPERHCQRLPTLLCSWVVVAD